MRTCPICNSSKRIRLWRSDFLVPDGWKRPKYIDWFKCDCGMIYGDNPDVTQADYDWYYINKYGYNVADEECRSRLLNRAGLVVKNAPVNAKILDFGGGDSGLTRFIDNLDYTDSFSLYNVGCGDELPKGMDIIVAEHVLEHIYDLNDAMKKITESLKAGGVLIVDVPDAAGISFELNKFTPILDYTQVHISIDGMDAESHDSFRRATGSYSRCIRAMEAVKNAGMQLQIATVVNKERARSEELERFFEFCQINGGAPSVVYAKPVGEWAGRTDILCTPDDIAHVKALLAKYGGYDHTTVQYGIDFGCLAVKRMVSITAFGDVLPCPWMYFSLGNIKENTLDEILTKGMNYFGEYSPVCRLSESKEFNDKYISKLKGRDDIPSVEEVMG